MKKIFIVITFLMFTTVYFSNAQVQASTEAISLNADGSIMKKNTFIIITTKSYLKDLNINSINISGLDDGTLKNTATLSFETIMKVKQQAPSNNVFMQLLNSLGAAGFSVVGTCAATSDLELITTYTLSISN
ncbi:MAG: hypothetical protein WCP57_02990 [Bacteroidota bacterium]